MAQAEPTSSAPKESPSVSADIRTHGKRDPWLRRMTSGQAGKGDRPRPLDKAKFEEGYDRVFGKCSQHEQHDETCIVCRRIAREKRTRQDDQT